MPREYTELQAEHAYIVSEAKAVIEKARHEKRDFTAAEQADNNARYAKAQTLRMEMKQAEAEQYARAAEAMEKATGLIAAEYSDGPAKLGRDAGLPKCHPEYGGNAVSESPILRFSDSAVKRLGYTARQNRVEFADMLRAMVLGPKNEAERFALAQSSDSTGGFSLDAYQSAVVLDGFRGLSILNRAGAGFVPLGTGTRIATLAADPGPTWRAENGPVTVTQAFGSGTLAPKSLAVIVKISRELLEDAVNANEAINSVTARAMAEQVDAASLYGAGGVEPLGVANQAGVQVVASAANGTALTNYNKILDAILAVETKGYSPTAVIMSPRESRTINGFSDSTGQPLRAPGSLQNLPLLVSPKVPVNQTQGTATTASTILVGDFRKALVAVRSPLRVEVLKENYAENMQYGFLFWLRMDVAVTEANAFAKVTGII
jgi:HK97 family phage major capsid protein